MAQFKQITVFGGSGFIGRHIVRRLATTGAIIRVPTRDREKALLLKPMGDVGQVIPMMGSSRSDASVARAVEGSDLVINLLGTLYGRGQNSFQALHVETAARIARSAHEAGAKRFIQFSALGADAQSKSVYARSKADGERAVLAFFPDATIIRPSIVFGPEDKLFNRFAAMAALVPALPLIGGGTTEYQPVYVGDLAAAVMAALATEQSLGATYELGGPVIYSFRDMMQMMLEIINRRVCLISMPWGIAKIQAAFMELLPVPPLTRDQVEMLKTDNIVKDPQALTFADLGISPTAAEVILPTYLDRFTKPGVKLSIGETN